MAKLRSLSSRLFHFRFYFATTQAALIARLSDTTSSNYFQRCNVPHPHKHSVTRNSNNVSFTRRLICSDGFSWRSHTIYTTRKQRTSQKFGKPSRSDRWVHRCRTVEASPSGFAGFPVILTDTNCTGEIKTADLISQSSDGPFFKTARFYLVRKTGQRWPSCLVILAVGKGHH